MTSTDATFSPRVATPHDVQAICAMRESVLGWDRREGYVTAAVQNGHAVVAHKGGALVGFRYQHALSPDVLGDGLLLVAPALRGCGLGRSIVAAFERSADPKWSMSVVLNTDLLPAATPKGPATGFWVACGYDVLASTAGTRLLAKHLHCGRAAH